VAAHGNGAVVQAPHATPAQVAAGAWPARTSAPDSALFVGHVYGVVSDWIVCPTSAPEVS